MSEDGYTRITLRIPNGLHAKLTGEAARTSKSMNAEIVARLERSFEATRMNDDPEFEPLMRGLVRLLDVMRQTGNFEHLKLPEGEKSLLGQPGGKVDEPPTPKPPKPPKG
ncbi:MAG: Arc family DNA-binding protein [Pseudomonas sp.]